MKPMQKPRVKRNYCDKDTSILVISALRYSLDKSASAESIRNWITEHWLDLDNNTQQIIVQEVFDKLINTKQNNDDWKKFALEHYQRLDYNTRKNTDYHFHGTKEKKNWYDAHIKPHLF